MTESLTNLLKSRLATSAPARRVGSRGNGNGGSSTFRKKCSRGKTRGFATPKGRDNRRKTDIRHNPL